MDLEIFASHFPDFPTAPEDLQKLSVMLASKKLLSREEWNKLKTEKPDPAELIKVVAALPPLGPKDLGKIEADIMNIPFVDLEETQIPTDVMKMFKVEVMVEHKIIPIKLSGQELLMGFVCPKKAEEIIKILSATSSLAMRPGKVLLAQFEVKIKQFTSSKPAAPTKKSGPRKKLGDVLIDSKFITAEQLKEALDNAKKEKLRLGAFLVKKGLLTNKQLSVALSRQFEIPFVDLEEGLLDPILGSLLPKKVCYEKNLCPVKKEDKKIVVAFTDPTDILTIDFIEKTTGMRVSPVVASELAIVAALDKLYGETSDSLSEQIEGEGGAAPEGVDDALGDLTENAAPIIKLVNLFFTQAVQTGVSDIHIEPFELEMRIRFRKDGVMKMFMKSARAAHPAVVSRIKVMSSLDIAETRVPQDGRIKLNLCSRRIDVRVSTVPTVWGEKICMRLCDQGNLKVNLSDLGFEPHVLEKFMAGVKAPNGIVLVTGPTGSGKTTTLYSALFLLNTPGINIMTAEDPVEYNLMGINQVQCHADIGLDFAAALRSFLRQDPNVIMIGEIRDLDTASIAIKAAMTGHLVISTLHTNDAPGTIARLLNMGVEPFALTTSIRVVEAQRLVRKICKSCYTEFTPTPDLLKSLGINQALIERLQLTKEIDINKIVMAKGAGCPDCDNSGYKGRQGIYEVLIMTEPFRHLIEIGGTPEEMRKTAIKDGMITLRESALYKLLTKRTTSEEVVRTTLEGGDSEEGKEDKVDLTSDVEAKPGAPAQPAGPGAAPGAVQTTQISVPSIDILTREMQAFRNAMEKIGGGSTPVVNIANEALKQNITDPLAQMQNQIKAGLSGGDVGKILPSIHAQSQKMDFNLKNLVNHFSAVPSKPGPVKLNDLVEKEIIGTLKQNVMLARLLSGIGTIGTNLKVTKSLQANLPNAILDPESFQVIAINLIVNALIAMPKGGEIKIVTRTKPGSKDRIELAIIDSGVGIPVEKQNGLFTPFSPIDQKTLGLGLSVVKKLVSSIGGQVSLKSAPKTSTLVVLEIPCQA